MVESVPNAILLLNRDGKIVYINNQAEKLFGYDRTELIGQVVEELLPHRYRKNHPSFRDSFFFLQKFGRWAQVGNFSDSKKTERSFQSKSA
ncbi:PAS domain protein [Leptospira weilii str. Ecochallenge]|uniref:PAS domain protein n=1 Tax=Leptospira weilii str. Ecochallenge TaxID=1049986 RepID=N1UA39_9LEPT|nr:PAS domain protein [Leptospira weilii str. Ecochallenge]